MGQRCAIYTRKSSEEGLEQDFNSLDAQREACEAFIRSQKGAGWLALPEMYDDGGISGGTLERPALQRLLRDIQAGRVDVVVVYKVDRLTRSLADFAKIVEAFDARSVSFVSVTQQFNTTTSMGRLTLNMLLSFAQFEREVTGERIRDKIAASKQKGMWMGGKPPLGYDVQDRKRVVNAAEAETVRHIFRRYAALRSVHVLQEELDATGIRSKSRTDRFGRPQGAQPLARGALYGMLQNRLYRGEIAYKGAVYPGQHAAIIDPELWDAVQAALVENRVERDSGAGATAPSLLTGLVYDGAGERMSPTHASKQGRRYRYYVSQSLIQRGRPKADGEACRVPAADLEALVENQVCRRLQDDAAVYEAISATTPEVSARKRLIAEAAGLAQRWPGLDAAQRRAMLQALVARITVRAEAVEIAVQLSALAKLREPGQPGLEPTCRAAEAGGPATVLSVPAQVRRAGQETKLLVQGRGEVPDPKPDRSLLRLLGQAHRFGQLVMAGQGKSIAELAREAGVCGSHFTHVVRLCFLAPEITRAILQGQQPPELTATQLKLAGKPATLWSAQRNQLGFR